MNEVRLPLMHPECIQGAEVHIDCSLFVCWHLVDYEQLVHWRLRDSAAIARVGSERHCCSLSVDVVSGGSVINVTEGRYKRDPSNKRLQKAGSNEARVQSIACKKPARNRTRQKKVVVWCWW